MIGCSRKYATSLFAFSVFFGTVNVVILGKNGLIRGSVAVVLYLEVTSKPWTLVGKATNHLSAPMAHFLHEVDLQKKSFICLTSHPFVC